MSERQWGDILSLSDIEKDLELKLRLMRLFWNNGFFVRRNINLVRYESGKKTDQYTDIDVVCIKYDQSFNKKIEICDCKSGSTAKTAERIFWLSGVMKYFGASKGYFVRSKMMESKYNELANKLEISPISEEQLISLEKLYNVNSKPFLGSFNNNKDFLMCETETFRELKKALYPVYEYISYKYWKDSVQQQIISLIDCGIQINDSKLNDESKLFLCMYCITLLTNSILELSQYLLHIPEEEQENIIKEKILGGKLESYERINLLTKFYNFMKKEIEIRYKSRYPISKSDFLSQFYPPYMKYLIDLIQRISSNPNVSISAPNLLDILTYELVLNHNDLNKKILVDIFEDEDLHDLLKITKDIIIFGQRSGFFNDVQSIIITGNITKLQNEFVS